MKKVTLILLVLYNMIVCALPANTLFSTRHLVKQSSDGPIDLMGDLIAIGTRSLYPIFVTQYDDYLEVIFVDNQLGDVSIEISDNMNNLLYQNTINGNQEKILIISVSNSKNGKYEIKFTNSEDKFLKGQFVIQK